MTRNPPSVLSRIRFAGLAIMAGVALAGAIFYAFVNDHFVGSVVSRSLGPYTDALADIGFSSSDPAIWRSVASRHDLWILVEPPDGEAVLFDPDGQTQPVEPGREWTRFRAERWGPDQTKVTMYWTLSSFGEAHLPLLGSLLIMVAGVVGSGFWFLQQQLKPLSWLRNGVNAIAQGDFAARVPVVRNDEIGEVAEAFNEMAGRVGEMIEDRERLLGDVSHELRSPLSRMKVALEFMPEGPKRDALDRDIREMEGLVVALLEREELRSRSAPIAATPVDLTALTAEVVETFKGREPRIELISNGAVPVNGDANWLELLVKNLLDNAVKFSRPGASPVQVEIRSDDDGILFTIRDDGIGVPTDDTEKLFEPFVKLDPARGHESGYGLGLNLCQRIVHLHGGTIDIRPREEGGTEVLVRF